MTAKEIIAAFEAARQANHLDRFRQGNIVKLPVQGDVVMTGDLHGHERNFDKLIRFARLDELPHRHLVLHELVHSNKSDIPNQCHSYQMLGRAAELKAKYPHQVHIMMGNHEMAQVTRDEVLKNGQPMVRALNMGLTDTYGQNTTHVVQAMEQFILSMPLAVNTQNRIWMSHSLPSLRHLAQFDYDILEQQLDLETLRTNQSLHALIWDRAHSKQCVEELQKVWNIDMFIIGHQPQSQGYSRPHEQIIILASDHDHGCFLPFELNYKYNSDDLFDLVRPLASIA